MKKIICLMLSIAFTFVLSVNAFCDIPTAEDLINNEQEINNEIFANINNELSEEYENYSIEYINSFLRQHPEYKKISKEEISYNDFVLMEIKGYIDNEHQPSFNSDSYVLRIGSEEFPEIENEIIGKAPNDVINININNGVYNSIYGGTTAKIRLKIKGIVEPIYYDFDSLTSQYLKDVFNVNTFDQFYAQIETGLNTYVYQQMQTSLKDIVIKQRPITVTESLYKTLTNQYRSLYVKRNYGSSYIKFMEDLETDGYTLIDYNEALNERLHEEIPYKFALISLNDVNNILGQNEFNDWILNRNDNNCLTLDDYFYKYDTAYESGISYLKKEFLSYQKEHEILNSIAKLTKQLDDIETFYSDEYKTYKIPEYPGMKTYMDYRTITAKSSKQYKLEQYASSTSDGLRTVNNRYLIAIGTCFKAGVGQYVDIKLKNGTLIHCIVGDIKSDRDTDSNRVFTVFSKCCSEFIIDKDYMCSDVIVSGNVSNLYPEWKSPVEYITVYGTICNIQ